MGENKYTSSCPLISGPSYHSLQPRFALGHGTRAREWILADRLLTNFTSVKSAALHFVQRVSKKAHLWHSTPHPLVQTRICSLGHCSQSMHDNMDRKASRMVVSGAMGIAISLRTAASPLLQSHIRQSNRPLLLRPSPHAMIHCRRHACPPVERGGRSMATAADENENIWNVRNSRKSPHSANECHHHL